MNTAIALGFSDQVLDSQSVFRAVMRAMAAPGRIETLTSRLTPPTPLEPAAAAIILALCDFETRFWLSPEIGDASAAAQYIAFHADAGHAVQPDAAQFAVAAAATLDLTRFHPGLPAYPDRSATVIVQCPSLEGGPARTIAGPGIAATSSLSVAGLPPDFDAQIAANRARFPLGVDLVFVCDNSFAALPRTTRILGETG